MGIAQIISVSLSHLKTQIIKLFCKKVIIGRGSLIYFRSKIYNYSDSEEIIIGSNTMIGCTKRGYHAGMPFYTTVLSDGKNSKVIIGDCCRINGAYIHAKSSIQIGNNCVIASGVNIIDSNAHVVHSSNRTIGTDIPKPIIIGNNVWIGLNAIILKGTVLGDNCVVAAGTTVKGNYISNSIISGQIATSEPIKVLD